MAKTKKHYGMLIFGILEQQNIDIEQVLDRACRITGQTRKEVDEIVKEIKEG